MQVINEKDATTDLKNLKTLERIEHRITMEHEQQLRRNIRKITVHLTEGDQ